MTIDINKEDLDFLKSILSKHFPDCEFKVFGSRVNGTAKSYSDIDIAIMDNEIINKDKLYTLQEELEESDISIRVDIHDWNTIEDHFKKIIDKKYIKL